MSPTHTPSGAPRVLHYPVVHGLAAEGRVGAVADDEHAVVEVLGRVAAALVDKDALLVEHEVVLGGVDGHRDRSDGRQRLLESLLVARLEVHEARARGADVLLLEVALLRVSVIGIGVLGVEAAVLLHILEGVIHETAVAAGVVEFCRAVDELLLGERDELAGSAEVSRLERAGGREGPARAALALILDGRHGALLAPVDRVRHAHALGQLYERAGAGVLAVRHVEACAEHLLAELLERPVGEGVHAKRVRVHAERVLVVVLFDVVQIAVEDLLANERVLLAKVLLAVRLLELVPQVETQRVGQLALDDGERAHEQDQRQRNQLHFPLLDF